MVNIRKEFPRKYMSAADLDDGQLTAQIVSAEMTTFKSGDPALMLTLRHRGTAPKMVRCNQTNRNVLGAAWGWDTDRWLDKKIELSVQPTAMGLGIRMLPVTDSKSAATSSGDAPLPPPSQAKREAAAEVAHRRRRDSVVRERRIMGSYQTDHDETALSWPDRIECYRRVIGRSAFMSYEDGWAFGVWFLGNSWAVKSGYYGGYPQGYLRRVKALFPDKTRVLHLFSGMVDTAEFSGDTLDIRPEMKPTYLCDAQTLAGVPVELYDLILADPPYSAEDADHYGTQPVSRNKVVEVLSHKMRPAAHLAWLDQAQPMYAKARLKPSAAVGITAAPSTSAAML